jgi:MFS transporter, DHA2 family, multidrug resistance protein
MGYTPFWAGRVVACGGIIAVFLGPVIGVNIHRLDARAVATFGFVVIALVSWWNSTFPPDVDFGSLALARFTMGLGVACFFLPIVTINMSGLAPQQLAAASGLSNFMRNLGSSFGTAIMVSFWDHRAIAHHAFMSEHISAYSPAANAYLAQLQDSGFSSQGALAQLNQTINGQAYLMATNDLMLASAVLMLSLVAIIWWARPPFGMRVGGGH